VGVGFVHLHTLRGDTVNDATITTHLVAWATTSAAGRWDTYGVAVLPQERDTDETGRVVDRGEMGIPLDELDGDAVTPDGETDYDALDALLGSMGYRRLTEWDVTAFDELTAHVELIG